MVDVYAAIDLALIAAGFLVLNEGAKFLTDNAAVVAGRLGASRFAVGALLVSTLAALPEVLVSALALSQGSPEIALSNALASNVVTIAFVIGFSAVVVPIRTNRETVMRDAVFLATVTIVASALLLDGNLSSFDGLALVALFVPYSVNLIIAQRRGQPEDLARAMDEIKLELSLMGALFGRKVEIRAGVRWLIFGVVWAVVGAQFIAFSAIQLSIRLAISPWIVGITAVAVGTSLPDIVAAYHATRRGFSDLALGEGIGACVVTSLLTLGTMGLLLPSRFAVPPIVPAIGVMVAASLLLLVFLLGGWKLSRPAGATLVASYFVMVALSVVAFAIGA